MEFDPLSRDLAPPRYEIESGSEEEDYDLEQPVSWPSIELKGATASATGSQVVVLIQQAGLASLDQSIAPTELSAVFVQDQQQASISATVDGKTFVYVSPTPQLLPQSRYHELTRLLLDHLSPSNVVVVDSYSPAENVFRSDNDEHLGKLRYLADPSFPLARIDASFMVPLTSPESVSGLGAAFLTASIIRGTPALLALLENAQSHVQLYGSASKGNVRLSHESMQALRALISSSSLPPSASTGPSIITFAKHSRPSLSSSNLALGDGNMYI